MPPLQILLFGSIQVVINGQPVTGLPTNKTKALLAYLAVEGHGPQRRETLAGLFWSEHSEASARANLRQTLHLLRATLPPAALLASRHTIQLDPEYDFFVDVTEFSALLTECRQHLHSNLHTCPTCIERLQQAAQLYQGEFLDQMFIEDSPAFEEWMFLKRRWLLREALEALHNLTLHYEQQGAYEEAYQNAWRQVELDPLRETAHQQLVRVLALDGRRSDALAQYETYCTLLAEGLGVEPDPEITALYEQIRANLLVSSSGPKIHEVPAAKSNPMPTGPLPDVLQRQLATSPAVEPVFVAREREVAQLQAFLDTALSGRGQVVFVTGEAGSGKSALMRAFSQQAQARHRELVVAYGVCTAYTGVGDPYLPFRNILAMLAGDIEAPWSAGALSQDHALRLWRLLPQIVHALLEHGPNLLHLFLPSAGLVERFAAYGPDERDHLEQLRRLSKHHEGLGQDQSGLFREYGEVLIALAGHHPLLILLDDLHWVDASSASLLFHLGQRFRDHPILIVGAYRPEDVATGWRSERHPLAGIVSEFKRQFGSIQIDLDHFQPAAGRYFVDALLDAEPNRLDEEFRQALFRHSRGHPLFTIELLRNMQERQELVRNEAGQWVASHPLAWNTVPARVEGVLEKRIGRLDAELREILEIASVEGETFTAEVVARVQARDERALIRRLSRELDHQHGLVRAQRIGQLGPQRLSLYRFHHHLLQRYLYHTLDEATQIYLHEDIGHALEDILEGNTEQLASHAGQLAWHFQAAGITEKALAYRVLAGEEAVRLSANVEAVDHFEDALALLLTLPETPARRERELSLLIKLAVPMSALKGYAHADIEALYARASRLGKLIGDTPDHFYALAGLGRYHAMHTDLQEAQANGEQLMAMARRMQDRGLLVEAHRAVGGTAFHQGRLPAARATLEQGMALYPQQDLTHAFLMGHDPAVTFLGYLAHTMWLLGYPDQALEKTQELLAVARKLSHPFSLSHALVYGATKIYQFCGAVDKVATVANEGEALAIEYGFPFWATQATIMLGWVLTQQGQVRAGIQQMHTGLADWQAIGSQAGVPYYLSLIAETHASLGEVETGLARLADAFAVMERTRERWWEAELYRLRGELLLLAGTNDAAESDLHQAWTIARQQQAHALELRSAMSLFRYGQQQGDGQAARPVLAAVYERFGEGFDTPDLQRARILLDVAS